VNARGATSRPHWRTVSASAGRGVPDHGNDKDRSSPINFREAFAMDGVEIVSLQHGEPTRFRDFAATAEVIESCDAVVTVDTSCSTLLVRWVFLPT
jgi:MoaA/NifB/PqqE/SkfB family radical SAM enzyme